MRVVRWSSSTDARRNRLPFERQVQLTPPQVLVPWATGLVTISLVVRRWKVVRQGYHRLLDASAAGIGLLGAYGLYSMTAGARTRRSATLTALVGMIVLIAALIVAFSLSLRRKRDVSPATVASEWIAAAGGWVSCVGLGLMLDLPLLGITRAFASMAFLGAVTAAMLLGHWYLVDPDLPRAAITRLGWLFLFFTGIELLALLIPPGVIGAYGRARPGIGSYLPPFWIVLSLTTLLLGVAVIASLRERGYPAVMAATGLAYLAILSAFGVDVIGKALIST